MIRESAHQKRPLLFVTSVSERLPCRQKMVESGTRCILRRCVLPKVNRIGWQSMRLSGSAGVFTHANVMQICSHRLFCKIIPKWLSTRSTRLATMFAAKITTMTWTPCSFILRHLSPHTRAKDANMELIIVLS